MYIVILTYTKPPENIDRFLDEHVNFLDRHYASGLFLASGRRAPRTGGIILAANCSMEILLAALGEDPFKREGLADYEIIEFEPSKTQDGFESLFNTPFNDRESGPGTNQPI